MLTNPKNSLAFLWLGLARGQCGGKTATRSRRSAAALLTTEGNPMLVLTRKAGESLRIGDVEVTLLRVNGQYVRLGINAPQQVQIVRSEIDTGKDKS